MGGLAKKAANKYIQKRRFKMFNMHRVDEYLDIVITELNEEVDLSPEIASALELIESAKDLLKAYSDRMRSTPYT